MPSESSIEAVPTPGPSRSPGVLQVLPALEAGGVERGTVDIAAAIAAAGWRAVVVSSGGPMVRELERAGAAHVIMPVQSKNPAVMRRNTGQLAALIAEHDIDIVHARSRAPAWSARAAARRTGRPFVSTFHGTYNAGHPLKRWYNGIMAKGDRVIAISEFIAGHVRGMYRVDAGRLRTIPRGIDVGLFDPTAVSAARMIRLVDQWRLPDGVPVVMLPGRLARWKGHAVLIDAIAQLDRDDVRCLLVGAGGQQTGISAAGVGRAGGGGRAGSGYGAELRRRIIERGLESSVAIIGHCDDMAAAYMLADVVVSASIEPEAFGRIAAEAQAMGRPVVATDHGGARETVIPGRGGWLVKPGDAGDMARAIGEALALDSGARSDLAAAARAHICGRYTAEQMCASTLDVYRELMG